MCAKSCAKTVDLSLDHVQVQKNKLATQPLSNCIEEKLKAYFDDLDGQVPCHELYKTIINQVERPLLKVVLERVDGNKVKAAEHLGISRNTLLKKMKAHGL